MSILRRKSAPEAPPVAPAVVEAPTVGKGRPTPKRREAERRRGPVAPPPKTQREAVQRSRSAGKALTKDERRAMATERRQRMMRGDDAYLLPRDRGPVRAYVRDLVDARRNIAGLLLPIALLSFIVLLIPSPLLQAYGPLVLLIAILAAVLDTMVFARQLSRKVAERFPKGDGSGLSTRGRALGFYAFNRACLPRRWRVPRPRVGRSEAVS
ncbi:DUF3043 domain-containing protein [Nakamurella endophytica]|uniref:DUF3043 domain-containing protein n=1 Tax=Nakamurella endophytica TaxID=1748367 RepID=A0A917WKM4_9ACTN|nr:DUF3043 domain-containing protein [Nakamurella endophytica]GGM12804.1 hypothetical protein GCM10011594_35900 [Nakamurella endophytica]